MSDWHDHEITVAIAERDGGYFCHYCGTELMPGNWNAKRVIDRGNGSISTVWEFPEDKKMLTIDHVIPQSRGGKNNIENLVLACQSCNSSKCNNLNWRG